jgi:hypothetical protein
VSQKNLVHKRFECSEEVPAFSVVAISDGVGDYRMGFTVAKPSGNDTAYAATGKIAGSKGLLTMGEDLIVRYDGTIAVGDRCRPKSGDWVMEKNSGGKYVCIGLHEKGESGTLKLFTAPSGGIPGRTGTTMGSATCTVKETDSSGNLTSSGDTITVYNWARFAACKNGDRYGVAGWINAAWVVIAEDCTDDGSTMSPQSTSTSGGSFSELVSFGTISPQTMLATGGYIEATTPTGGTGGGIS